VPTTTRKKSRGVRFADRTKSRYEWHAGTFQLLTFFQCFPPHRSWPGQRCNRCEHHGDPCGVGLTASEDKQVRRHQRNREGSAVERLAVQHALMLGVWNDQSDNATIEESSGSATPNSMQQIPTAVAPIVQYNPDHQCPPVSGILETSNPENGDIAQGAGLGSWIGMLDSEYHAATLAVQEIQPKEADLHFPLDSFADATYIHSDRSNSEDTSAFGSPPLALSVTPSALPCELQSVSLGSPPDQGSTVVRHSSSWNPLDVAACFSSMQWTEYVPTTEYEPFASSCSTFGVPIFSLKMKPSDQTMRNAMEFKLDLRMAILYGDPCTYTKVCSRKFGNTLAEWYREDVRQLAHCVSDCLSFSSRNYDLSSLLQGYLMVKHALFACMAADSLITYRKLEKKRKQFGGDLTPEESHFRDQYRHAFEKYYRGAFHLLEASMEEYKSPASTGSLPAKPLLYTCYLLGVAVVSSRFHDILWLHNC
jgi:hypothetical protein